jgi:hypothetical protein
MTAFTVIELVVSVAPVEVTLVTELEVLVMSVISET